MINYMEIGWWDYLSMPIAMFWFFGLTWVMCMGIIQTCFLTNEEVPAQPPFGRFCGQRRNLGVRNRAP